jgi:hypothetical protein
MAVVTIPHQPYLTPEAAMEVFRRGLSGQYMVYQTHFFRRDFIVKKNRLVGVGVKLKQKPRETSFVFAHMAPSPFLEWLCGGWLVQLVLRPDLKGMEEEVRSFIERAPEFRGMAPSAGFAPAVGPGASQGTFCAVCRTPLSIGARFCFSCGTAVAVEAPEPVQAPTPAQAATYCARCGAEVPPSSRFCHG